MPKVRPVKSLDEDFVYHSWLSSVDRHIPGTKDMTRTLIDHCMKERTIHVACADDDDDHILGWLAHGDDFSFPVLHYVFVKKQLRNHGIGKTLLTACLPQGSEPILTSFWSFWCQKFDLRDKWNLKHNSLILPTLVEMIHGQAESEQSGKREASITRP